jgi:phosphoglycolate phosphatase
VAALINPLFAEIGRSALTPAMAASCFGLGALTFVERAVAITNGPAPDPDRLAGITRRFLASYAASPPVHSRPFPGVVATLAQCRARGWRLGVCTNKPAAAAETLLSALDMMRWFDGLSGGDSAPARKPDPRHLLDAIARAGGNPARAIMVGDSETDAATARAAAIPVVLVAGGYPQGDIHRLGATRVVPGFAGLETTLSDLDPA